MRVYGAGLFWCALALAWPALEGLAGILGWPWGLPVWVRRLHPGPWVGSVGLAYLALLSGAVSARDYGLDVGGTLLSIPHILEALCLGSILAWGSLRLRAGDGPFTVLEEPRWALYRALGWAWSGSLGLGLMIAVACALLERILERLRTTGSLQIITQDRSWLLRVIYSNSLFGLTMNFWLLLLGRAVDGVLRRVGGLRQAAGAGRDGPGP
jgi:hypothetical protein